jgi:hypothetical protein
LEDPGNRFLLLNILPLDIPVAQPASCWNKESPMNLARKPGITYNLRMGDLREMPVGQRTFRFGKRAA